MNIQDIEHRGISASIHLNNGKGWISGKDKFRIDHCDTGLSFGYCDTLTEIKELFVRVVDEWMDASVPKSDDEWVSLIESCMVWTGYETCNMSKKQVLHVLSLAAKHYSPDSL